tara:strand:+ start:1148 stop:1339 length:192 start_codon:yes stop_codon:yes gene_type:complete
MISGWGATILMRGIAICSVVGLFLDVLSGGNLFEGDNLIFTIIIVIVAPIMWYIPKWMGMADK